MYNIEKTFEPHQTKKIINKINQLLDETSSETWIIESDSESWVKEYNKNKNLSNMINELIDDTCREVVITSSDSDFDKEFTIELKKTDVLYKFKPKEDVY